MSEQLRRWTGEFICGTCASVYVLSNAPHLRCRYRLCSGTMRPFNEATEFAVPAPREPHETNPEHAQRRRSGDRARARHCGESDVREIVIRRKNGTCATRLPIEDKHDAAVDPDSNDVVLLDAKENEIGRWPIPRGGTATLSDADEEEPLEELEEEDEEEEEEEDDAGDEADDADGDEKD